MKLTDEYNAEIAKDFLSIKVGCQTIDIITINSLIDKIEKDSGKTLLELKQQKEELLKNVPKKITDLIHSFEDAVEYTKFVIPDYWQYLPQHRLDQEKAEFVISVFNEGWEADFDDSSQYKYYIWWKMDSSGGGFAYGDYYGQYTFSHVGVRLLLKSKELCQHIGNSPELVKLFKGFMVK